MNRAHAKKRWAKASTQERHETGRRMTEAESRTTGHRRKRIRSTAMKKAKKPVGTKLAVKKSLTKPKRDVEDHYFTARSDSHALGDRRG